MPSPPSKLVLARRSRHGKVQRPYHRDVVKILPCSHWEAQLLQLCSRPGPHQTAGGEGSKPTIGWDGLWISCLTWIFVTICYLSLESLRTLEENPHIVAPGFRPLWVQEPQEELDGNPEILGLTCPQLADQDPNLERGKPMRAGLFLSEVEVSPWP